MHKRLNLLREFSVPLLAGVAVALTWVDLAPTGYHQFNHAPMLGLLSFHFLTNELFMVLFFGLIAGLGLTVALFVAGEAFTDPLIQGAAKMGALCSVGCGILAIIAGRLMRVQRRP